MTLLSLRSGAWNLGQEAFVLESFQTGSPHVVKQTYTAAKRDSIHHNLLEMMFETATALESRQTLLYTNPFGGGGV